MRARSASADVVALIGLAERPARRPARRGGRAGRGRRRAPATVVPGRGGSLVPSRSFIVAGRSCRGSEGCRATGCVSSGPPQAWPRAGRSRPDCRRNDSKYSAAARSWEGSWVKARPRFRGEGDFRRGGRGGRVRARRPSTRWSRAGLHLQARLGLRSFPRPARLDVVPSGSWRPRRPHARATGSRRSDRRHQRGRCLLHHGACACRRRPSTRAAARAARSHPKPGCQERGAAHGPRGAYDPSSSAIHSAEVRSANGADPAGPGGGDLGRGGRPPSPLVGVQPTPYALLLGASPATRRPGASSRLRQRARSAAPIPTRALNTTRAAVAQDRCGARRCIRGGLGQCRRTVKNSRRRPERGAGAGAELLSQRSPSPASPRRSCAKSSSARRSAYPGPPSHGGSNFARSGHCPRGHVATCSPSAGRRPPPGIGAERNQCRRFQPHPDRAAEAGPARNTGLVINGLRPHKGQPPTAAKGPTSTRWPPPGRPSRRLRHRITARRARYPGTQVRR